ncbi:MAG: SDR family NAD(P)-dependent oxidoreductase [Ilumatobacteraceae bacterium]
MLVAVPETDVTGGDAAREMATGQHGRVRELMGAVVVVVGATGGLGAAVTDELRRRGATVLGAGRGGPDIVCDLRDGGAGDAVVRGALGTEGRLDGVVNAAGVVAFGALADTDPVVVEELFLTNTMGPMWLARSVVPALAEARGFFAAITGVVAEQPVAGMVACTRRRRRCPRRSPGSVARFAASVSR